MAAIRDVVVVGGGAAGLSAALTPVRAGEVVDVSCASYGFLVVLRDGAVLQTRRLLIATGLVDELPDIPGVREQWGHGVLHCPYCHGWEVRDRRIGVLATEPMSAHKALLFRQWSADVVLFAGDRELEPQERARLDALGVSVTAGGISRLEVDGDRVSGVRPDDGQVVAVDVVVVSTRMVARTDPFARIGIGPTSDAFGKTAVPGVWVAGNTSDISAQVSRAAAEGARAARHINADLVMDDLNRAMAARADDALLTKDTR